MALSATQTTLLTLLQGIFTANGNTPVSYMSLKNKADMKSFDGTFNALLHRQYVEHAPCGKDNYSNLFILSPKGQRTL